MDYSIMKIYSIDSRLKIILPLDKDISKKRQLCHYYSIRLLILNKRKSLKFSLFILLFDFDFTLTF